MRGKLRGIFADQGNGWIVGRPMKRRCFWGVTDRRCFLCHRFARDSRTDRRAKIAGADAIKENWIMHWCRLNGGKDENDSNNPDIRDYMKKFLTNSKRHVSGSPDSTVLARLNQP